MVTLSKRFRGVILAAIVAIAFIIPSTAHAQTVPNALPQVHVSASYYGYVEKGREYYEVDLYPYMLNVPDVYAIKVELGFNREIFEFAGTSSNPEYVDQVNMTITGEGRNAKLILIFASIGKPFQDQAKAVTVAFRVRKDVPSIATRFPIFSLAYTPTGKVYEGMTGDDADTIFIVNPYKDPDGDGKPTATDIAIIASEIGRNCTQTNPCKGDLTGDGKVTQQDLRYIGIMLYNGGRLP